MSTALPKRRVADIFVPPSQILDTVNIYHLPHRHRKISLRFLSWVVLQQDIQSTGTHDSIEDARTALQLYEKHSQLEAEGEWEHLLEDIYIKGGRLVRTACLPGLGYCLSHVHTELESTRQRESTSFSSHGHYANAANSGPTNTRRACSCI